MQTADEPSSEAATDFLVSAIKDFGRQSAGAKVLDFGCGKGGLAGALLARGFDTFGCDIDNDLWNANTAEAYWQKSALVDPKRLAVIQKNPYRLPYEDNTFDVILSTSVLEHAQNKEEIFLEIHRVLKPGGMSLHILPSKWYLPIEPHINVPLVNFFWPHCPKWWLNLWALLGVKNSFQAGLDWRTVANRNYKYCQIGLSYWTHTALRRTSIKVFGNYDEPMTYFMLHSTGGAAALGRRLPFPKATAWILGHCRMFFFISYKQPAPTAK